MFASQPHCFVFFFFNDTATTEIYTLSLHDALPIFASGPRTSEFAVWSLHSSGWTALRLNQMARARDTFTQFQTATPSVLEAWALHGLGLANYALGRHDEAVAAWTALASRGAPARLARDVSFWLGEAAGGAGPDERSVREPTPFVRGGPPPLLEGGWGRARGGGPGGARAPCNA